jgi:hypothetical protein
VAGGRGEREGQRRRTISAELDVAGVVAVGVLELGFGAGEGGAGVWRVLGETGTVGREEGGRSVRVGQ